MYSAACNVPFPIIYKLNRENGSCNVISMDWLLSPTSVTSAKAINKSTFHEFPSLIRSLPDLNSSEETSKAKKKRSRTSQGGALLTHLQAMVGRELRRPGLGARLFVQACVLSGCDYAPSQLSGVGLVNAFKLVMENTFRDHDERFARLLKSLPKSKLLASDGEKVSKTLSSNVLDDYDELLAKSEAVFYYHRVMNVATGNIVPLIPGSTLNESVVDATNIKLQIPSLMRFPDESFIASEAVKPKMIKSSSTNEKNKVVPSSTTIGSPFFRKTNSPIATNMDFNSSSKSQNYKDVNGQVVDKKKSTMKSILNKVRKEHEGNSKYATNQNESVPNIWSDDDECIESPVSSKACSNNPEGANGICKRGDQVIDSIFHAVTQEDSLNKSSESGKELWSDGDDDCIIIENPKENKMMPLHRQNDNGGWKRYQSQDVVPLENSESNIIFSATNGNKYHSRRQRQTKKKSPLLASFSRAEELGVRAKFASSHSTPKNNRTSQWQRTSSIVTVSSKKRRVVTTPKNLQSIKGFFKPLR